MGITAIIARMGRLADANIHHLIDQAEEPERMLKQLVREMDEQIVAARRALAHQAAGKKLLERQQSGHLDAAQTAQEAAAQALREGDEAKARELLDHRLAEEEAATAISTPLTSADDATQRLRGQLRRLQSRRGEVERRRVELTLRQRAASASRLACGAVTITPGAESLDTCLSRMEARVTEMEAEAEVFDAGPAMEDSGREQALRIRRRAQVEEELTRLRERSGSNDSQQPSGNQS